VLFRQKPYRPAACYSKPSVLRRQAAAAPAAKWRRAVPRKDPSASLRVTAKRHGQANIAASQRATLILPQPIEAVKVFRQSHAADPFDHQIGKEKQHVTLRANKHPALRTIFWNDNPVFFYALVPCEVVYVF
jgi:hypothetical protein